MVKDPRKTVWLRMFAVVLIFFVLNVTLASQPIRSQTVDLEKVLIRSAGMVFLGPALPIFNITQVLGFLAAVGFWCALIGTAWGSKDRRLRWWSYGLLAVYIVMASLGILVSFAALLISMAHAI